LSNKDHSHRNKPGGNDQDAGSLEEGIAQHGLTRATIEEPHQIQDNRRRA
jgi:hypothetical protein